MFAYRSCGRLPCSFPGLLTSGRKLWNHISTLPTTSHLSSSLFNTSRFCAHLLDSPQLSFHLSLSSPLNAFELVLTHLTAVPPVYFLLSPVEVTQLQTFLFRPVELPFHSIMVFNIRLSSTVLSFSCMYYHSILLDCWLLPVGPTFKHAWAAASVKSAWEQHSRTRLWVLLPERPSEEGHASSTAARATGVQRGVANGAQPSALLPCFFLLHFQNVTIRNFHAAIVTLRWTTLSCKTQ